MNKKWPQRPRVAWKKKISIYYLQKHLSCAYLLFSINLHNIHSMRGCGSVDDATKMLVKKTFAAGTSIALKLSTLRRRRK